MAMRSPWLLAVLISWCFLFDGQAAEDFPGFSPLVTKESRRSLVSTESGAITAVDVHDGRRGPYHLQFITFEPSSLFLPVLLHTDMVFYVHTGRGSVSWVNEDGKDGLNRLEVERGDIYRLEQGSVFYVQSHPDPTREKLTIHSIFNTINNENIPQETFVGAYSNVSDLVRGFDDKVLQMGFRVSEEAVHAIKWAEKPSPIVHFAPNKTDRPNWNALLEALVGGSNPIGLINGKKKTNTKAFNVFRKSPDVKNCNGWSLSVTDRRLRALKGSDIGVFMVNLTKGSMVAPHWNPKATEVAIVIHGHGIVQIVCPSNPSGDQSAGPFKCDNMKFRVKEGDVFIVPRFHPMAQISFNDDSLVFMGFSTSVTNNRPQFFAGKWSVLQTIDKEILVQSFATSNTTIEELLSSQDKAVMLECTSCAEEVEQKMEEEMGRKRQEEEAKKREEEEARRKQEEEEARRRQEEARKREEEETKRREEEARRREEEEEARREQEEESRRREEEARKREEEETKKREEQAARKEEEEAKRREEEEKARTREEEEARREEEEESIRREEEARKREEEETREREEVRKEEEEAKRREEEEEAGRGEEEEARRREEEEIRKRAEEEAKREEEEEARRREEEASKRVEEEARREEGEDGRQQKEREKEDQEEQVVARREEEEKQKQIKEEVRMQEKEQQREEAPDGRRGEGKNLGGKVMSRRLWRV